MKKYIIILSLPALLAACQTQENPSDAYGNFEATEITLSAEVTAKLLAFSPEEGDRLAKGDFIAQQDTIQLHLRKKELLAQIRAIRSRQPGIASRLDVLQEEKANVAHELERFEILAREGAATTKQVDDLRNRMKILDRQLAQARTEFGPLLAEMETMEVRIAQLDEQIADARLTAPLDGTVLVKLAEAHEMVNAGTPLLRLANLEALELRAYISGTQLDEVQLGQEVEVLIDKDKEDYHYLSGNISWISGKAEFTPKIIQTKEERTDLVYAMKVKVKNDGRLKIGMPGEVRFAPSKQAGL
jgi:HlyD family secretion protein